MFKNLSTSTKLYALCAAFVVAVGAPVCVLVAEKRVAIDFARKELVGSRYLAGVREAYAATTALSSGDAPIARAAASGNAVLESLARAEAEAGSGLETRELGRALADALRKLWAHQTEAAGRGELVLDALARAQALAARIGDDPNLALDPELDSYYLQNLVVRLMPTLINRLSHVQNAFETMIEFGPTSSRTPDRASMPACGIVSSIRSSRPRPAAWGSACRFADRSSRRTAGGYGRRPATHTARSSG